MPRLREMQVAALLLVIVAVASACGGGSSDATVNVKTVATDLTYGIPEPANPAPPPNLNPIPTNPVGVRKEVGGPSGPIQTPSQPAGSCPKALLTDFPEPAPSVIAKPPAEGTYNWRVSGRQNVPSVGPVLLPVSYTRKVSDVTETADGFSFVVEERELVFGSRFTVRSTYELRRSQGALGELTELALEGVEPAGIYLTRIERINPADADSNSVFSPSPAVLIIPHPAVLGDEISSVGVDPISLEVLRTEGAVTKRQRVDACGKNVDTYFVKTVQTFVGGDGGSTTRQFWYGIATGLGGLPVVEHIESPCVATPTTPPGTGDCQQDVVTFEMNAHIGQLVPN